MLLWLAVSLLLQLGVKSKRIEHFLRCFVHLEILIQLNRNYLCKELQD